MPSGERLRRLQLFFFCSSLTGLSLVVVAAHRASLNITRYLWNLNWP